MVGPTQQAAVRNGTVYQHNERVFRRTAQIELEAI